MDASRMGVVLDRDIFDDGTDNTSVPKKATIVVTLSQTVR
jgi:hypothetical protein